jgi:hypothetical protein
MEPLVIELFAGLHGWGEGFVAEGYRVIGFDIVDICAFLGVARPKGIDLVLQDVLTLHGSQFKDAAVIVASPPCQEFSYRWMPWNRYKELPAPKMEYIEACYRIARESNVPLVLENVKGAERFIGRAKWHYGSIYLWGEVPALFPSVRFVKRPGADFNLAAKGLKPRHFNGLGRNKKESAALSAKIPFALARHIARCFDPRK